jgi:hypothetical protein
MSLFKLVPAAPVFPERLKMDIDVPPASAMPKKRSRIRAQMIMRRLALFSIVTLGTLLCTACEALRFHP